MNAMNKPRFLTRFLWFILMLMKSVWLAVFHLTIGIFYVTMKSDEYEEDIVSKRIIRSFFTVGLALSFHFKVQVLGFSLFIALCTLIGIFVFGRALAMTIEHFDRILMKEMGTDAPDIDDDNEEAEEDLEDCKPGYFDGLSPEEAKATYRRLLKMYHPDNKETGDRAKLEEIMKEYKIFETCI